MNLWSQLPSDLLHQITNLLPLPDLIRFGCVCTSWQFHSPPTQHRGHLPWLLLPLQNNSPKSGNTWSNSLQFYSILDNKFHKLDLPEIKDRRICGSSNGWLITIYDNGDSCDNGDNGKNGGIYLFHPFSKKLIQLPSLNDVPGVYGFRYVYERYVYEKKYLISDTIELNSAYLWSFKDSRDEYIVKLVVCPNRCVVIGMLGKFSRLFLSRRGTDDNIWVIGDDGEYAMYVDVCFYKREFYAVNRLGGVVVVDCKELCTRRIIDGCGNLSCGNDSCKFYLVESLGEFLKVIRFYGPSGEESDNLGAENGESRLVKTVGFEVWKVDFERGLWLEVKSLGDRALFLGINQSISISSSEFPGCRGNCIYFTDDCKRIHTGGYDKGVCNLENGIIEAIYPEDDSKITLPWPIWYSSFHGRS